VQRLIYHGCQPQQNFWSTFSQHLPSSAQITADATTHRSLSDCHPHNDPRSDTTKNILGRTAPPPRSDYSYGHCTTSEGLASLSCRCQYLHICVSRSGYTPITNPVQSREIKWPHCRLGMWKGNVWHVSQWRTETIHHWTTLGWLQQFTGCTSSCLAHCTAHVSRSSQEPLANTSLAALSLNGCILFAVHRHDTVMHSLAFPPL
jgi:hypothetical protein